MYSRARPSSRSNTSFNRRLIWAIGNVSSLAIPWSKLNVTGAGGSGKNSGGPEAARSEYRDLASNVTGDSPMERCRDNGLSLLFLSVDFNEFVRARSFGTT